MFPMGFCYRNLGSVFWRTHQCFFKGIQRSYIFVFIGVSSGELNEVSLGVIICVYSKVRTGVCSGVIIGEYSGEIIVVYLIVLTGVYSGVRISVNSKVLVGA